MTHTWITLTSIVLTLIVHWIIFSSQYNNIDIIVTRISYPYIWCQNKYLLFLYVLSYSYCFVIYPVFYIQYKSSPWQWEFLRRPKNRSNNGISCLHDDQVVNRFFNIFRIWIKPRRQFTHRFSITTVYLSLRNMFQLQI